jgi:hypothetical protein
MPKSTCVCGAVEWEIQPPYRFFQYCHCSRCRKRSGSLHAANVAVPAAQLAWTKGEEHVKRWEHPDAERWCSAFCDTCGSALPWRSRDGLGYVVPVGGMEDEPGERPTRNIFYGSRAPWHVDAATLPTFETTPPKKA